MTSNEFDLPVQRDPLYQRTFRVCRWCGDWHRGGGLCPRISEISYHENGRLQTVKFHPPVDKSVQSGALSEDSKTT